MEMLDTTAVSTALPKMAHDFQSKVVYLSAGITSYILRATLFINQRLDCRPPRGKKFSMQYYRILTLLNRLWTKSKRNILRHSAYCQGIALALMVPVGRFIVLKA